MLNVLTMPGDGVIKELNKRKIGVKPFWQFSLENQKQ